MSGNPGSSLAVCCTVFFASPPLNFPVIASCQVNAHFSNAPRCDFVGKPYDSQNNLRSGTERFKEVWSFCYIVSQPQIDVY